MGLTTGGPSGRNLPDNWETRWGYHYAESGQTILWVGEKPATKADVKKIEMLGYRADPLSLVGTLNKGWSAEQYENKYADGYENEVNGNWDFVPKQGGVWSLAYQMQHTSDKVDRFAEPRWWIVEDGEYRRAKGGEPVKKVDLYFGIWEWRVVTDEEYVWDEEDLLWRPVV